MVDSTALFPVNRGHLDVLTDDVGIHQHAIGPRPDPAHGYCTDDVARALGVDLLHARELGWPAVADRVARQVRFLQAAFDPATGRFRNFRSVDGSWVDAPGSEDCHARAMLALGETIAAAPDPELVGAAATLFGLALPAALGLAFVRPQAAALLACEAALGTMPSSGMATVHRHLARRLRMTFSGRGGSTWPWPEARLTYENALPVRALIRAGATLDDPSMTEIGLRSLDWLIEIQTTPDGRCSTIGNGWWGCGGERSTFDQQPIEATDLLLAAEAAYQVTGDGRYRLAMERAYGWFLGANDVAVAVADPARGACHDGLTPTGVNSNQGAESTLMWHIALEHIRDLRRVAPAPGSVDEPRALATIA